MPTNSSPRTGISLIIHIGGDSIPLSSTHPFKVITMAFKLQFNLLSPDYVAPTGGEVYMKMAKAGSPIKFVIVGTVVTGYSYWTNDKEKIRSREYPKVTPNLKIEDDGKLSRISHFWVAPVYDCLTETVRVLEITQRGLQDQLTEIFSGNDYDLSNLAKPIAIKISATGEKLLTKYTLMPIPLDSPTMIGVLGASEYSTQVR